MIDQKTLRTLKTLGVSLILISNIFIFIPVTIYIGNQDEFYTPILGILKLISIPALIIIFILVLASKAMNHKIHQVYLSLLATVGLLVWLQGNILLWDYGPLDGRSINWGQSYWRGILDASIWLILIVAAIKSSQFMSRFAVQFLIFIFFIQSLILAVSFVQNNDALKSRNTPHDIEESFHQMYRFSSEKNVLHVILDSFQADIFKEIVTNDQYGEQYRAALDGFTFYEQNTGGYPYTYFSLPAIISGELYYNELPKSEFNEKVYSGNTILNAAYSKGYEIDLANDILMLDKLTEGSYTNEYLIPSNYHVGNKMHSLNESAKILDLTLFRLSPHFLKPFIYNNQRWLTQNLFISEGYWNFFYYSHNAFLHSLASNLVVDREKPVYKFFHIMSPHAPIVVNNDCSYAGGQIPRVRETVLAQSRCSLDFVIALLNAMKAAGIYNNSLIILMADHGGHIDPANYNPEINESGYSIDPWVVAMATPLMLVKTPQAKGQMRISTAPTSMLDTAATVNSLLGLEKKFPGESIPDVLEGSERERKFYYYAWRKKDNDVNYILPIQELVINGSPYDSSSWKLGNIFKAPVDN